MREELICDDCDAPIPMGKRCGPCGKKHERQKCYICRAQGPHPYPGPACHDCRKALDHVNAVDRRNGCKAPHPLFEERMALYEERAERKEGLFA